ncbi:MAG: M28 family peptidase [candidate division WOR-3 bacterium]
MKFVVLVSVAAGAVVAGEFLAVVPGAQPEDLAAEFTVVGQTGSGVLVVGDESRSGAVAALGGRILDTSPRDKEFYRVHVFEPQTRQKLAEVGRILDFDGEEYLVAVAPEAVEQLIGLPVMAGRISLSGWVFRRDLPKLPAVFTNPLIQQMVASVTPESVLSHVARLQRFRSRYSTGDSCRAAVQWMGAKLLAYGCDSVYYENHTTNHAPNVIGIRFGTSGQRNPYAIIDGHIDGVQNCPAADDNGSGTAATIEAARVMQPYRFTHDLRFIGFTGEEFGLYGSDYYAGQARQRGDSILGVLNFDMIGYVDAAPENLDVLGKIANPACEPFVDWFTAIADTYTGLPIYKRMVSDNQNSDHGPFWNNGYLAFCGIEDFWPTNPYYHTAGDSIGAGYNNNEFCTEVTRTAVAALATLGEPIPSNQPMVGFLRSRVSDSSGNNNGFWDPGESVAVYVTLKNFGMVGATQVNAAIACADTLVTLFSTSSGYGSIGPQETAVGATPFLMRADSRTPREHVVRFDLTITAAETSWQAGFSLEVGRYLVTDPIPDGPRWPPLYWAYDDVDSGYAAHPEFDWVEINSVGTRLTYPQNDDVIPVTLPTGFGPLVYYGQSYSQVSISADGWVVPGSYTTRNYSNTTLPNASAPPGAICVNWDDLYPDYSGSGSVYYYHDAGNNRFVIEYDSVAYYNPSSVRDKFQLIIYDTTVTTPTGDNAIVAQYLTANRYSSSTVGMQDPTRTIGIQCLYNNSLTRGAAPIAPRRAIRYVTLEPTGLKEQQPVAAMPGRLRMLVRPNPVKGKAELAFASPLQKDCLVLVFDRSGRVVDRLKLGQGRQQASWDAGRLAPGVYFLRLAGEPGARPVKVILAR